MSDGEWRVSQFVESGELVQNNRTRLECEVSASLRKTCECQSEEYGLYPFGSAEPLNTFKQ